MGGGGKKAAGGGGGAAGAKKTFEFDPAAKAKIWEEHLKKEERMMVLSESYADPKEVDAMPMKVTQIDPSTYYDGLDSAEEDAHATRPSYDAPRTTSEAIGFFANLAKPRKPTGRERPACEETKYADNYYATFRRTPFQRAAPIVAVAPAAAAAKAPSKH